MRASGLFKIAKIVEANENAFRLLHLFFSLKGDSVRVSNPLVVDRVK